MDSLNQLFGKDYMKKFNKLSPKKKKEITDKFKKEIDLSEIPAEKTCTAKRPDKSLVV